MSDWLPIESAPKDGSEVRVKRVYKGRIVKEGMAVFDHLAPSAPSRAPMDHDPLNRMSPADCAREARDTAAYAAGKRWLLPGRMYAFPTPTHWHP